MIELVNREKLRQIGLYWILLEFVVTPDVQNQGCDVEIITEKSLTTYKKVPPDVQNSLSTYLDNVYIH